MEETEAEEERQFSHRQVDNKRGPGKAGRRVPVFPAFPGLGGWNVGAHGRRRRLVGRMLAQHARSRRFESQPRTNGPGVNDCDPSTVGWRQKQV